MVYFVTDASIYRLTTSGFERISQPVDSIISSSTYTSSVLDKPENRLRFAIGTKMFLFNLDEETWDVFSYSGAHKSLQVIYDDSLYSFTRFAGSNIHKLDSGLTDAGDSISFVLSTRQLVLQEFAEPDIDELLLTYKYNGTFNLDTNVINGNGTESDSTGFDATTAMTTRRRFLERYGETIDFSISSFSSVAFELHSIGVSLIRAAEIDV